MMAAGEVEGRRKTTIEELPNELLLQIFRRVNKNSYQYQKELERMQQVCRRWYGVIDRWIGMSVTSSTPLVVHPSYPELKKQGLELISEIGVSELSLSFNDRRSRLEPLSAPSDLPYFKYPYLLEVLSVWDPLHPDVFRNLTKDLTKLKVFIITFKALAHLRNGELTQLNFPGLKKLEVLLGESNLAALIPGLPNLRALMKENHFRQLTRLRVDFPVESFQDLETLKVLIPFIFAHRGLESLFVSMGFPKKMNRVEESIYQEELDLIIAQIREENYGGSLKRLSLWVFNLENPDGTHPQLQVWSEFLKKPSSLKMGCLGIGPLSYEVLQTFCSRNGSTLEELQIDQLTRTGPRVAARARLDCTALSSLKCLKRLDVRRNQEVTGVSHLPPTLEEIQLTGFMRTEEVEAILLNHPNVMKITLATADNEEEGYGVTPDILRRFVQDREVSLLTLSDYCVNGEFPEKGIQIPNEDPVNPTILVTLDGNLTWVLNEDGYYTDANKRQRRYDDKLLTHDYAYEVYREYSNDFCTFESFDEF